MARVRQWLGMGVLVALVLIGQTPTRVAAEDEARRDLPPNYVAQRLGGPIVNFVLPPGAAPGPTSATAPVASFRFKARGTISVQGTPGGGTVAFAATGEMQGTERVHLLITASGTNIPTAQSAELSLIGSDLYLRTLTLPMTNPGPNAGQWLKTTSDMAGLTAMSNPMPNLLDAAAVPVGSPGMRTLPDEMVNGSLTTHLRLTADPSVAGGALAGTGIAMPQATIDAYIGKSDNKLHRLALVNSAQFDLMTLAAALGTDTTTMGPTPTPNGTAMASLSFTIDFTNFNDPTIAITAPANAIALSQVGGNAGGFPGARAAATPAPMPRVLLPPVGMPVTPSAFPKP